MDPAYPGLAVIVDLDPVTKRGADQVLMPLAVAVLAVGFGALLLRPAADPGDTARARERVLAAFPSPTSTAQPASSCRSRSAHRRRRARRRRA